MITQSRRLRIKPTIKNPLSEKLRAKHESSFIKTQNYRAAQKERQFPKS